MVDEDARPGPCQALCAVCVESGTPGPAGERAVEGGFQSRPRNSSPPSAPFEAVKSPRRRRAAEPSPTRRVRCPSPSTLGLLFRGRVRRPRRRRPCTRTGGGTGWTPSPRVRRDRRRSASELASSGSTRCCPRDRAGVKATSAHVDDRARAAPSERGAQLSDRLPGPPRNVVRKRTCRGNLRRPGWSRPASPLRRLQSGEEDGLVRGHVPDLDRARDLHRLLRVEDLDLPSITKGRRSPAGNQDPAVARGIDRH
jgi:hypothetical protein